MQTTLESEAYNFVESSAVGITMFQRSATGWSYISQATVFYHCRGHYVRSNIDVHNTQLRVDHWVLRIDS